MGASLPTRFKAWFNGSMQWKHPSSRSTKKFKVLPSAGKVMLAVCFQKRGENVKFCWSFVMQFAENVRANWQEGCCFIMKMSNPIQPEQPRREFKKYSEDFLNIRLIPRTWPVLTSFCLVLWNTTLVANVSLMTKRLKRWCGNGWDISQRTYILRVLAHR
jgi:hypothetical protein